jgi:hypothetical protein
MGSRLLGGVIMFYFGIDWSKDHHNLCIMNAAGARVSQIQFKHTMKGFEQIEDSPEKRGAFAPHASVVE